MNRPLINSENSLLRNTLTLALLIIILPVVLILKLIIAPFERPANVSSEEVVNYLQNFLNDTSQAYDWDDFISVPIQNTELEKIRIKAMQIYFPLTEEGKVALRNLLIEAEKVTEYEA